ncbi:MAG: hypothetical protein HC828_17050 [Blastochloris sp.]|nr:hypothetical protein [Blastochloris sp.]
MEARLEHTLVNIARHHAPLLVGAGWRQPGDFPHPLPTLANDLARTAGIVVIVGEVLPAYAAQRAVYYRVWADQYVQMYRLLCGILFPSYLETKTIPIDNDEPVIVGVQGQVIPVIEMLAGYIAPYIVARQGTMNDPGVEITGIIEAIFDELHAETLKTEARLALRREAAGHLRTMLASPVHQFALTPLRQPIFHMPDSLWRPPGVPHVDQSTDVDDAFDHLETMRQLPVQPEPADVSSPLPARPAALSTPIELPLPPDSLPEEPPPAAPPFNPRAVPIFYRREDESKPRKPRPPIPGLPRQGD